jgi:hypothetical protein
MAFVEHPRDWLGKPVMRDTSLQIQTLQNAVLPGIPGAPGVPGVPGGPGPGTPGGPPGTGNGVGNLTQVNVAIANAGLNNPNGIIDPNESFTIVVQLVNGSTLSATGVTASNVTVTSNLALVIGGGQTVNVGTLLAGQTTTVQLPGSGGLGGAISVLNNAPVGTIFFVDFDVTANGVTRRYRTGPIVVGTTGVPGPFIPATPLN